MSKFTPIIILGGEAGSGKDTAGNYIASKYNGQCIGQADPLKRFAMSVFGFTEEQLWGPSESRNAIDPRFEDRYQLSKAEERFSDTYMDWVRDILPDADDNRAEDAGDQLGTWFWKLVQDQKCSEESLISPRRVLQTLGTEYGRQALYQNVWVDYAERTANELLTQGGVYNRTLGIRHEPGLRQYPDVVIITDGRFRNEFLRVRSNGGYALKLLRPGAGLQGQDGKHQSESEFRKIPHHFFNRVLINDGGFEDFYYGLRKIVDEFLATFVTNTAGMSLSGAW